jgi:enoyl-CoA hydratase
VEDDKLIDEALRLAGRIARADLNAVRMTKRAINRSVDAMGMQQALQHALEIEVSIETTNSPKRQEFERIHKLHGLKTAIVWRDT